MKLRNAGLLLALLAAVGACKKHGSQHPAAGSAVAQTQESTGSAAADPWQKAPVKKDPLKKPLFWSIEKDGKTDYILGTMHTGIDPETRLPDIVWQKFDAAKSFAMETNLADAGKLDFKRHDGTTLQQELGPEYWKKLEDALGVRTADALRDYKATIPVTLLSLRGLPQTPAMDSVLQGRAINENKQRIYLEDVAVQGAVLEKWMDTRELKDMLDDLPIMEKRLKDMLAAYVDGDDVQIEKLSNDEKDDFLRHGRSEKEFDAELEDILYKRNESWIPEIEQIHGDAFIAVGAMHLIGKRSVLDLLRQKGYTITRVTPSP